MKVLMKGSELMKFYMNNMVKGIVLTLATVVSAKADNEGKFSDNGYTAASQSNAVVTERRAATATSEVQISVGLSQISERLKSHTTPSEASVSLLPTSGGNTGSLDHRGSIWARAGFGHMNEGNITRLGGWNAGLWSFAMGYDYKVSDKVLLGAALTYSNLNGSTKFNNGNIRDNVYGVVPYAVFKLSSCFDIDLMFGYSRVNKKRDRGTAVNAADTVLSGTKATSSPKSDRYFAALFGNFNHHVNYWNLLVRLGYMHVTDRQKSYNEANGNRNLVTGAYSTRSYSSQTTNMSRVSLRLQAGYKTSSAVEPYAFLTYSLDFGATKIKVPDTYTDPVLGFDSGYVSPNKRRSNDTFGGGLGLNADLGNNWGSSIETSYQQSKKFKNTAGWLRISKKF